MATPEPLYGWETHICPEHGITTVYWLNINPQPLCGRVLMEPSDGENPAEPQKDEHGFVKTCGQPAPIVEVVRRSELDRVEAERDLALRALGHDSYEAAQQYLMSALSGPGSRRLGGLAMTNPRTLVAGRMLDSKLKFCFGRAHIPQAGYTVDLDDHGYLYRNGEHQGYARVITFDRETLGWWVEYEAFTDTPLGGMAAVAGACP